MRFLKTTFESTEYNIVHGFQKGNQRISLAEDANGDYFVGENVKGIPEFSEVLESLNNMEIVNSIEFKLSEEI